MKWLATWVTFSCVVVPAFASVCAWLRERTRDGQVMPTIDVLNRRFSSDKGADSNLSPGRFAVQRRLWQWL